MALIEADLIVEDGSGLADANAYIDFAFADEYHRLRANEAWADADENSKVAAIVRATDYVDRRWRFVGSRFVDGQALAWPRDVAYDKDGFDQSEIVPAVIENITAEYALRAVDLDTRLLPDPETEENGQFVTLIREKVGPIEDEKRYDARIPVKRIKPYPEADAILLDSGLTVASGNRAVRA